MLKLTDGPIQFVDAIYPKILTDREKKICVNGKTNKQRLYGFYCHLTAISHHPCLEFRLFNGVSNILMYYMSSFTNNSFLAFLNLVSHLYARIFLFSISQLIFSIV